VKLKGFMLALGVIVVLVVVYLAYYGLFAGVDIKEVKKGPYVFVYGKHIGPYKDSGKVADRIYKSLLNDNKIETFKGIGIYYDKPGTVDESKLRSVSGCIIEEGSLSKIDSLKGKYKIGKLPESTYITVEFPFKGLMSIMIGIFKVYPKLEVYFSEKGYDPVPMIEIYDVPAKKIYYLAGIKIKKETYNGFLKE